jgi:hypothetical protein
LVYELTTFYEHAAILTLTMKIDHLMRDFHGL